MVVLVTGASSGIGRATAIEFAKRHYSVVVLARRKDLLQTLISELKEENPKGKFLVLTCDISKWSDVTAAFESIEKDFGKLNVLVNNAGAFEYAPFEKSSAEKLEEMINVNVRGVIYATKAAFGLLKKAADKNECAKVINVSSIAGLWGFTNMVAYSATKFAVTGFTSALRREWRSHKIDVASIHPGPVRTWVSPKEAERPKKAHVMLPPEIASQICDLATLKHGRRISHPTFSVLNVLENVSSDIVDKVLKKIL